MTVRLLGLGTAVLGVTFAMFEADIKKSLAILALGWLAHVLLVDQVSLTLPHAMERLEHLVGMMSLVLIGLFWLVLA